MTFNEFHNALRILLNIDLPEFADAVYPDWHNEGSDDVLNAAYRKFRDDPHNWFIRAPDNHAKAIWKIVEERNAGTKTSN